MPRLIQYNEQEIIEKQDVAIDAIPGSIAEQTIVWIDIDSTKTEDFEILAERLSLHQLMIEDIRNSHQLPKFELIENISFLSLQMLHRHPISHEVQNEHLSILISGSMVYTIQDGIAGDVFEGIRNKLRINHKRLFKAGPEYLFLAIVDAVVDEYLAILDSFRLPFEDLELNMIKRPSVNVMKKILEHKTRLNEIRRLAVPLREELQRIRTENPELVKKPNHILFRDIQDHMNSLVINFENLREMLRDLSDLHQSNQNLQLNNTMKTLTGISAVFIPLTFIVGVYGMNFHNMPELNWKYGYLLIWFVMVSLTVSLVWYMKKRKWF